MTVKCLPSALIIVKLFYICDSNPLSIAKFKPVAKMFFFFMFHETSTADAVSQLCVIWSCNALMICLAMAASGLRLVKEPMSFSCLFKASSVTEEFLNNNSTSFSPSSSSGLLLMKDLKTLKASAGLSMATLCPASWITKAICVDYISQQ